MNFSKDSFDIATMFMAYLACGGNSVQVAIICGTEPEVVEVLAARENWDDKLDAFLRRPRTELKNPDKAIRNTANYAQALLLRDFINRVLERFLRDDDSQRLDAWLSVKNAKTGHLRFHLKPLLDLLEAARTAQELVHRELERSPEPPPNERRLLSLREAMHRALNAANSIPGLDAVALVKDSLENRACSTTLSTEGGTP